MDRFSYEESINYIYNNIKGFKEYWDSTRANSLDDEIEPTPCEIFMMLVPYTIQMLDQDHRDIASNIFNVIEYLLNNGELSVIDTLELCYFETIFTREHKLNILLQKYLGKKSSDMYHQFEKYF